MTPETSPVSTLAQQSLAQRILELCHLRPALDQHRDVEDMPVDTFPPLPHLDPTSLDALMHDASSPNTPGLALTRLAASMNVKVRFRVAKNPSTPPETLSVMAHDSSRDVRICVSANPSTPPETLRVMAAEEVAAVRWAVAANPSTPSTVLVPMMMDRDEDVSVPARANVAPRIYTTCGIAESNVGAYESLRGLAWWEMTPASPEVMRALEQHPNS